MHDVEPPEKIAVFRALKLGDLVCATPALRALRQRFPQAHITLIGLPWARQLATRLAAEGIRWIDDFVAFPGHPALPEQPGDAATFEAWARQMRARRFDLAVQMHGSGTVSNTIVQALGARRTAGFHAGTPADELAVAGGRYWPYPDQLHEIHRNLCLVKHLGGVADDDQPAFPLLSSDFAELARHPDLDELPPGGFLCLHPGARMAAKRWSPRHFAAVGDALACNGWRIVITGDASEHALASEVQEHMRAPSVNAARDLSVGALAALLSRARLLVSNDTGVAHIAAALPVPSVVIFFATDPRRWAPLDPLRHRCVVGSTGHGDAVTPDEVIEAAWPLLALPASLQAMPGAGRAPMAAAPGRPRRSAGPDGTAARRG
ncbi:glycosyltransferase family 9 protein [Eleftheria terrae]|uniref:glycosyltransferase family 9 protein n=1 Tax=Eleftheria terrae TaxID=1597781 RepID=UPI00263A4292|nr:glycosyltransferase family 9 protein [Eleftheria terrae]WKB51772.1 glycosyltransferase family 9 protein [Eleftheria terrae]